MGEVRAAEMKWENVHKIKSQLQSWCFSAGANVCWAPSALQQCHCGTLQTEVYKSQYEEI